VIRVVPIHVAELAVAREPTILSTILGSCVSVCLFHPKGRAGGLIHFALPSAAYANLSGETGDDKNSHLRFGDFAVAHLIARVCEAAGVGPRDLLAKLVGGATVVDEMNSNKIGELNSGMARNVLRETGIPIVGEDVGGTSGRKIYFYTETGRLRVSLIHEAKKVRMLK
jgi:chemotaxis protein CheD